jgi:Protein of unknown function (DUF669)
MIDLAQLGAELEVHNQSYEKIEVEEQYSKIPEGQYLARVDKIEFKESQQTETKPSQIYLRWQLNIIEGEFTNRKLFRNNMLKTEENLKWLKTDLVKCGIVLDKFSDLTTRYVELLDLELDVYVKPKGDNVNVYINGLSGVAKNSSGKSINSHLPSSDTKEDSIPF